MVKATFAAGCFWNVQAAFRQVEGVLSTRVGYIGGQMEKPTSRDVSGGGTGHLEAVEIRFDPRKTTYADLLEVFFQVHDPTEFGHQGPEADHPYRSAVFYHDDDQRNEAISAKILLERSGRLKGPLATQILPATTFWEAESQNRQVLESDGDTNRPADRP
jgi:peptide-methionine (S)-S-oxide reductase